MNNRGKTKEYGLSGRTEGYLSWQDPESGEWMVLTREGSPFTDGVLNRTPERAEIRLADKPRRVCDRCSTRHANWKGPLSGSTAVA